MWLRDWRTFFASRHEVLRVGRLCIERWASTGADLSLIGRQALPMDAPAHPDCLAPAIARLYADPAAGKVSIAVESAWLPLLQVDTGGVLLDRGSIEALLRRRLAVLYGDTGEDIGAWDVRADFRAGERQVLGYGLSPRVKHSLLEAAAQSGLTLEALTPAFTWGWQRMRPPKAGWWLWTEQDRLLAACFRVGRMDAFNAAVPLASGSDPIERLVDAEHIRWGLGETTVSAQVACWLTRAELPPSSARVAWQSVPGNATAAQTPAVAHELAPANASSS